jgi:hypothetical protein
MPGAPGPASAISRRRRRGGAALRAPAASHAAPSGKNRGRVDDDAQRGESPRRSATKADIALLKIDVAALATATKTDLRELEQRLIIRLGGLMTLATGVLIAIKYFG